MKKLVLSMLLVVMAFPINANSIELSDPNDSEEKSCFDLVWDYGTKWGDDDPTSRWVYTDLFYSMFCE